MTAGICITYTTILEIYVIKKTLFLKKKKNNSIEKTDYTAIYTIF